MGLVLCVAKFCCLDGTSITRLHAWCVRPTFQNFSLHKWKFSGKLGAKKSLQLNTTRLAVKYFPPKNLICNFDKFFGWKMFTAKRIVFSGKDFWRPVYQKTSTCVTKNFEMWVVHTKHVDVLYFCRLASKNLRATAN